ncbi:hypothetical protein BCR41DRAFT_386716 [Lobosporangium transversale]|uniref:START domain-containing protein n=1 Tax=Lobosporangium transversale TaxID=64571 RepID=A0A1Y2GLR7_9FUNG|nr:hypothetical protein BCR41DRAFT_386716 [Lobosporangium transversale]ORZ14862.1 hypothetical protein BCR41DRAFT_386716 [Lobosporangium transversale]|eukprot:XP_021880994.1 hypothetical protein BCR41DRAFT_386716 [Lobosporangium transversale]
MSNLQNGPPMPSSAASAAIESLLPSISVSKKSVPGKSAEIVRASITLPGLNEQTDLEDWRAVLECPGARKIWDPMVDSSTVLMTLDDSTCITKTIFKTTWPASPRDALLIETTLLDHNAVLHIATSIKPSEDDPIFMRPSPPHVRAYLPLVVWHIQLVPADIEDTISFTSFNSLAATHSKPVMPRHSIRVSFYYQIDMRGWAVNSSVSMQSHVPSCIANVYRLLRRQGVPPHVSRHSARIQLDLNEYDPATGIYELRYDVIPADSDDLLIDRKTVSSALKQFRLGGSSSLEEGPELIIQENANDNNNDASIKEDPSTTIPPEHVLSDDDELDEIENELSDDATSSQQVGYVDVELDGEKWGLGSDIVVHIFMNDIEDEEFVREHVECLKYMGRNRYILRMKHTNIESNQGATNVKLRIERIPQQQQNAGGAANLMTHQQLLFQRQQQEQERLLQLQQQQEQQQPEQTGSDHAHVSDPNGLIVSVNGHEKNIRPFRRSSLQNGSKRGGMSLQEQLELSQQIVEEVNENSGHWRSESDGAEVHENSSNSGGGNKSTTFPLLLMSSSMSATKQSLFRSNRSFLSNGTSTMTSGNTNPSKVNNSYSYFSSLLNEPTTSWKHVTKQRGVQVSKLDVQGHAPGIVKGEGIFEDFSIWDIKAALDCPSARKIWDKMFDESHMLQHVTPSSTLNYVRLKGFWPTSPKDMAVLNTTFITKEAIHFFATSVDDTNQYPSIPPPVSPFVRSELVVSGWYLEKVKPQSTRIVYIAQAAPTGWMVPGTTLSAMTTEMPLCVAEIIKYLNTYGSPPTLVSIRRGRALGIEYSHTKTTYRLEYIPDSNPIFSGQRGAAQQQQQASSVRESTIDITADVGTPDNSQTHSPKLAPADKLLAEIRLDARVWAFNGDCDVTIDPPPFKVTCSCVPHDGPGLRLRVEHSGGRAVPEGGKVLLMARKPAKAGCGLVVNGVPVKMPSLEHLEAWTTAMQCKAATAATPSEREKDRALTMSLMDGALSEKEKQDDDEDDDNDDRPGAVGSKVNSREASSASSLSPGSKVTGKTSLDPLKIASMKSSSHGDGTGYNSDSGNENEATKQRGHKSSLNPFQYAQGALDLLMKIKADSEDKWSVVSDTKSGMKVTKRFMPAEISDQVPLVRGEKVIEGFSLEEIATVISTLGTRSKLDGLFDSGEMLESFGSGCAIFHHVLKSYFPLPLPARDLYFVTATAAAEAGARCPQIVIVSTSIPPEAAVATPQHLFPSPSAQTEPLIEAASSPLATASSSKLKATQSRPLAHLHLSAWILEGIDPYSSSHHPIPSTRVTFMTALDLGGSVPQRISGLLQTTFPKMITQVESYLQQQATPPIVRIPTQMVIQNISDTVSIDEERENGVPWILPNVSPWTPPASKMLFSEFNQKDSYCEMLLLFDQFQLHPSRLALAAERRLREAKKKHRQLRRGKSRVSKEYSNLSYHADGDFSDQELQEAEENKEEEEGIKLENKGKNKNEISKNNDDGKDEWNSLKSKQRTVLELVLDLKQYPMGYNIMTNIKVDPEFLLQQKQQRDKRFAQGSHQHQPYHPLMLTNATSKTKLIGSTSSTTLTTNMSAHYSATGTSTSNNSSSGLKSISGLDHAVAATPSTSSTATTVFDNSNARHSLDGHDSMRAATSSEAASSGTGIAAVLGSSANVPRALPSSMSLIRILPPPITVNVVDIPPAPSHSSSLSGTSKRRKHLIIVTVPEAESSMVHVNAQQTVSVMGPQAIKATGSGAAAPRIVPGTTTPKPIVTTSFVTGTNSTDFLPEDRHNTEPKQSRRQHHISQDSDTVMDILPPSPLYPGKLPQGRATVMPSTTGLVPNNSRHHQPSIPTTTVFTSVAASAEVETRLFQLGIKIDRLEHKDLDHETLKRAAKNDVMNSSSSPSNEKEWLGKVMVDGLPVEVITSWPRHELGYLDGMMETEVEDEEQQHIEDQRHSSSSLREKGPDKKKVSSGRNDEGNYLIEENPVKAEIVADEDRQRRRSTTITRRKSHRHQQIVKVYEGLDQEGQEESKSSSSHSSRRTLDRNLSSSFRANRNNDSAQPTSSMYGLSNILMNVGLFGAGSQKKGSRDLKASARGSCYSDIDYRDLNHDNNDRTIRAGKKSMNRGSLGATLSNSNSNNHHGRNNNNNEKHGGAYKSSDHHDLDLESLHGSIVFKDDDVYTDSDRKDDYGHDYARQEASERIARRQNGSIRRRRESEDNFTVVSSDEERTSKGYFSKNQGDEVRRRRRGSRNGDEAQQQQRHYEGPEFPSRSLQNNRHRRRSSRSSNIIHSHNLYRSSMSNGGGRGQTVDRRYGSTNGADHPRFRGSQLYAYSFRNLFWTAAVCFIMGLLLRIYVIGPSYTKTVVSSAFESAGFDLGGSGSGSGSSRGPTTYYYYHTIPKKTAPTSQDPPSSSTSSSSTTARVQTNQEIRELFTVRKVFGWDFVLLAYPSHKDQS